MIQNFDDREYPGWGKVTEMSVDSSNLPKPEHKHQLDIYRSTSIAGNDLLASVLYTTGLVAAACGQLAPIAVLLCVLALYPFKKIFQECGTECGTSWTRISSCVRSLDPGPLSRLRNEGFSANTCFSRPPHAPGHIEMILAFQTRCHASM